MTEMTFVQGDTAPPMTATLQRGSNEIGGPVTSVRFQMRKVDDKTYTVNATASILDQDSDSVSVKYQWGASDLNVPGDYEVQWEVTYSSGYVETTDPPNLITVRRQ